MDKDTRRIIIGTVLLAIGLTIYATSEFYQSVVLQIIGAVSGPIFSFVGIIVALMAVFRKVGWPS